MEFNAGYRPHQRMESSPRPSLSVLQKLVKGGASEYFLLPLNQEGTHSTAAQLVQN